MSINTIVPRLFTAGQVCCVAMILISASRSAAAVQTYYGIDAGVAPGGARPISDAARNSFVSAAGGLGTVFTIDFEAAPVGDFTTLTIAPGVTVDLVDDNDTDSGITTANSTTLGYNTTTVGTKHLRVSPIDSTGLQNSAVFKFTDPIAAFGAYFTGVGTTAGTINVVFDDGQSQSLGLTGSTFGGVLYFGFADAGKKISQVGVIYTDGTTGGVDVFGIDDLSYVAAIPEPLGLSLSAVAAVLGLALFRRRPWSPRPLAHFP